MTSRVPIVILGVLLATGCEGGLFVDVGNGGGGGGGPRINLDDGGAPRLVDGGGLPDPGSGPCSLPPEGVCEGDIARWCSGQQHRSADCSQGGQTCRIVGSGVACVDPGTMPPDPLLPDAGPGPGPSPTGCGGPEELEVIDLVNGARSSPLECDPGMARAARLHSQDMCDRGYFDHNSLDGRSPFDRMRDEGVSFGTAGENIAYGQSTPAEVHRTWMNSPGHRQNILGSAYRRIGVGYAECGGRHYWTQNFAD